MDPHNEAAGARIDPDDLAKSAAICFAGPHGRQLLGYLRTITIERTLGPGVDDAHLRHLEGQRQLVQHLSALISRGRVGSIDTMTQDTDGNR